jgi:hypothetical protein
MRQDFQPLNHRASGLVDVLDRVLDKGLAIAGDIRISLAEVELLTIRIRLIVCSIDKAQEIGLDWWKHDRYLAAGQRAMNHDNHDEVLRQLRQLERKVEALAMSAPATGRRARRGRTGANSSSRRTNDAR